MLSLSLQGFLHFSLDLLNVGLFELVTKVLDFHHGRGVNHTNTKKDELRLEIIFSISSKDEMARFAFLPLNKRDLY